MEVLLFSFGPVFTWHDRTLCVQRRDFPVFEVDTLLNTFRGAVGGAEGSAKAVPATTNIRTAANTIKNVFFILQSPFR
jgi:hypothetical protein